MSLKLTCPKCRQPHKLHEPLPLPGTQLHCDHCGQKMSMSYPEGLIEKLKSRGTRFEEKKKKAFKSTTSRSLHERKQRTRQQKIHQTESPVLDKENLGNSKRSALLLVGSLLLIASWKVCSDGESEPSQIPESQISNEYITPQPQKSEETITLIRPCNLRVDHNMNGEPIAVFPAKKSCQVLKHWNTWLYVNCDGKTGWVGQACIVDKMPSTNSKDQKEELEPAKNWR